MEVFVAPDFILNHLAGCNRRRSTGVPNPSDREKAIGLAGDFLPRLEGDVQTGFNLHDVIGQRHEVTGGLFVHVRHEDAELVFGELAQHPWAIGDLLARAAATSECALPANVTVGVAGAISRCRLDIADLESSFVTSHCGVSRGKVDSRAFDTWHFINSSLHAMHARHRKHVVHPNWALAKCCLSDVTRVFLLTLGLFGVDTRHGATAIRALTARLGAVFHASDLRTAVCAGVANFSAQGAQLTTIRRVTQHEVAGCLANLGTVDHQAKVVRFGALASGGQAMNHCSMQAGFVATPARIDTGLHAVKTIGVVRFVCMAHGFAPAL